MGESPSPAPPRPFPPTAGMPPGASPAPGSPQTTDRPRPDRDPRADGETEAGGGGVGGRREHPSPASRGGSRAGLVLPEPPSPPPLPCPPAGPCRAGKGAGRRSRCDCQGRPHWADTASGSGPQDVLRRVEVGWVWPRSMELPHWASLGQGSPLLRNLLWLPNTCCRTALLPLKWGGAPAAAPLPTPWPRSQHRGGKGTHLVGPAQRVSSGLWGDPQRNGARRTGPEPSASLEGGGMSA